MVKFEYTLKYQLLLHAKKNRYFILLRPKLDGVFFDLRPSTQLPILPTSTWFYSC